MIVIVLLLPALRDVLKHCVILLNRITSIIPRPFTLRNLQQEMDTPSILDGSSSLTETRQSKSSKRDVSPSAYSKPCDLCHQRRDVLVRCRIDELQEWHFVCTGKCWRKVSGGVIDGPEKPFYQYGGMWKNKHAGASAKKRKEKKKPLHKTESKEKTGSAT